MRPAKYSGIYQTLKDEIIAGKYPKYFPSDNELSSRFKVARETLRRAAAMLESENLISRSHGRRTLVHPPLPKDKNILLIHPTDIIGRTYEKIADDAGIKHISLNIFRNFSPQAADNYLISNNISGVILRGCHFFSTENIFETLKKQNIPTVLMLATKTDFRFNRYSGIKLDLRSGWESALRFLVARGYRRIATFAVPEMRMIRDIPMDEYPELLRKLGASDDPELIFNPGCLRDLSIINNPEPVYPGIAAEAERMLKMAEPPDAFLCFNDLWAPPIYQAIAAAGKKIPDDFAVMGFLSGQSEVPLSPALTTVHFNFKKNLDLAIKMLIDPAAEREIIPAEMYLLLRKSVTHKNIPKK